MNERTSPPTGKDAPDRPVGESLKEYGRGVVGGLLFSLPLLYTMEIGGLVF